MINMQEMELAQEVFHIIYLASELMEMIFLLFTQQPSMPEKSFFEKKGQF